MNRTGLAVQRQCALVGGRDHHLDWPECEAAVHPDLFVAVP